MKVGDLVTMKTPLTPERYGVGIIQKARKTLPTYGDRWVYHVLWSADEVISQQYDNEIVLVSKV